jgi:hypothetical protein
VTFEEFLAKVKSEPDRSFDQDVRIPSPEHLSDTRQAPFQRLDVLLADPQYTIEQRTFRTGHLLGLPVAADALSSWNATWPDHRLPQDLVELLHCVDGIHLWANLDEGRSYAGLAPIAEWQLARTCMWGSDADTTLLSDRYIALSYHSDGAAFIVLNVDSGKYFLMDSCGVDESCVIGASAAELLDWLWAHRLR